jgi:hypothetical protein
MGKQRITTVGALSDHSEVAGRDLQGQRRRLGGKPGRSSDTCEALHNADKPFMTRCLAPWPGRARWRGLPQWSSEGRRA